MRILLIEDDEVLSSILLQSLSQQHYAVDVIDNGAMGWEYAQSAEYDLILMDVGLPGLDGISLCKRLRSQGSSTPILLITAKEATSDRIRGLDAGADDYLIKPLNLDELQARVRALLRRGEVSPSTILETAGLQLDPVRGQVVYQNKVLKLTPKEYGLLELFLRNPTRLFSRGQIMERLWTFDDLPSDDSVKAHIKGLRQKLKQAGAADWIENVYGMGYRLNPLLPEQESQHQLSSQPQQVELPRNSIPTPAKASVEQQFNQAVDGLWQQYQGLMVQRMTVLQQAAMAAQTEILTQDLSQAAKQAAHKLAGVLGMFGKDAGTALAREIEQILEDSASIKDNASIEDNASITELQLLPGLVNQLDELLNLLVSQSPEQSSVSVELAAGTTNSAASRKFFSKTAQLVVIDSDPQIGLALQQFTQSIQNLEWHCFSTLQQAQKWLQHHTPDLLILNVERNQQWKASLTLLANLAAQTPPVPTITLTTTAELTDRIAIAQAGGRRILVKPVTAIQVWETASQLLEQRSAQAVKILAIDDDPILLAALPPLLEPWGIQVTGLSNPENFWSVLETVMPNLLILDVEMPQYNGIELCQAVRTDPQWQELPILFLTTRNDRNTIQQVFSAGADDYITKPLVGAELLTRITNRLDRASLLQSLANKDPITGLTNQMQSQKALIELIQQTTRDQSCFSFIILSITDLNTVNINYGHKVGNEILQRWGRLLQSKLTVAEIISYWGNGEFIVVIPKLNKTEARVYLESTLTLLQQQSFTTEANLSFQVQIHHQVAEYPKDGATTQALYQFCCS